MSPKILSRIWMDDDFWHLDNAGKVAFFWLLSNGETHHCGHLVLSKRQFASDTGMDADKALADLSKALPRAFVQHGQHLWLRNFMRHQFTANERNERSRMFKCLVNAIASMPDTLRAECLREYPEFYAAVHGHEAPCKPLASPLQAPSNVVSPLQGACKPPEQSRAEQSRAECVLEGGAGETPLPPVELPPGFPGTLAQAVQQAAAVGGTPELVEEVWNEAMSRGGRDGRDRPIRSWAHHVRAEALKPWRQGTPRKNGAANGVVANGSGRAKSLGAEIMDAENTRKRLVAKLAEHPCNEESAGYDPASLEYPDWQAANAALRAAEAVLRSIPKDAPEDWMRRLRREAFERALAEHPGNPESRAHDEQLCDEKTRREFIALRQEAGV